MDRSWRSPTVMMKHILLIVWLVVAMGVLAGCAATGAEMVKPLPRPGATSLTVMTWNIWHGGREDGEEIGPRKVVDIICNSGADIVAMQETYGSGEQISDALGFRFHPRGTNVSILSRYPIVEDISVFEPFKCAGGLIELPDQSRIAFYSIWLPYNAEIWEEGTREGKSNDELLAACANSATDLAEMLSRIEARLSDEAYAGVPIIIAGDFNSMSHLDYTAAAIGQYGVVIDWPTSRTITNAGFVDSYRAVRPRVMRARDRTWTPRFPRQHQDRIDFVYARGQWLRPAAASVIDQYGEGFPSDHAALVVAYQIIHDD